MGKERERKMVLAGSANCCIFLLLGKGTALHAWKRPIREKADARPVPRTRGQLKSAGRWPSA